MTEISIENWAAWMPGVETEEQWKSWCKTPIQPTEESKPNVQFLPMMLRRRCDLVSRMMLNVSKRCLSENQRSEVTCVFASKRGSLVTTVSMLEELAHNEPLSPMKFSHSVHNTQAGLFSIWGENKNASTSLSARNETFEHGFLESICQLHREPNRKTLLVIGDQPLPKEAAHLSETPYNPYALALLLSKKTTENRVHFELVSGNPEKSNPQKQSALEFLRFWLSDQKMLTLGSHTHQWKWQRL